MSAKTAAAHTPAELTYHGTSQDIAVLSSASVSRPGERNWTYLDIATNDAHCECRGAECGRRCWHMDLALAAYAMTRVAGFVELLSGGDLLATGQRAGILVATGAATITDTAVYWACKVEYARRCRRAANVVATRLAPSAYQMVA